MPRSSAREPRARHLKAGSVHAQHQAIRIGEPPPPVHETAREDRVDRERGPRLSGGIGAGSPEPRDIRADTHPINDADRRAKRTSASEDEGMLARAAPDRLQP